MDFTETRESGFLRFWLSKINPPLNKHTTCSSWRSLRPAAKQSFNQAMRSFRKSVHSGFTTASQPDAGFASCYRCCAGCFSKDFSTPQGALEKQYRLSLLQVFAMRQ
ncbi:MAG: hypothetical protein I8H81_13995 [Pseudomonadales bacterium]|nr:hypothetical protein [Pseudomonadales bacterium]